MLMDAGKPFNAVRWCEHNEMTCWTARIFMVEIPSDSYDLVMSTITLTHIPIYSIRQNYFRELCGC